MNIESLIQKTVTRFFAMVFFFLIISGQCFSQWTSDSVFNYHTSKGIEAVYNLDFQNAKKEFTELKTLKPDHPAGYFFLAMIEWWKIMIDLDNESNDKRLISMLDKVIDICDKRLDENESDLTALFFKGGSLGYQGRLYANRDDWVKAANEGRQALPIVQEAYRIAPTNYDVLLGIGIYNYYASIIPEKYPLVKPLMIFFPEGDKEKGIEQLREAANNSRYADVEASYFLLQLQFQYERKYDDALTVAKRLFGRFPNNVVFHRYIGRCYTALGNWEEMHSAFNEILVRANQKQTGYTEGVEREAEYYLGIYELTMGNYSAALKRFFKADELSRSLDKDGPSGFMVMSNLKVGMIYDLQSRRDLALKQYEKVLKMKDYQGSHTEAEKLRKTPYGK